MQLQDPRIFLKIVPSRTLVRLYENAIKAQTTPWAIARIWELAKAQIDTDSTEFREITEFATEAMLTMTSDVNYYLHK